MAVWYRVGTVSVTQGSPTVTGNGTVFTSVVREGDMFTVDENIFYEIAAVVSDTQLTLTKNYAQASASNVSYAIVPLSPRRFLASDLGTRVDNLIVRYRDKFDAVIVTADEINALDNVTSNVQTQLNSKVTGPASAVDGNLPVFDGATGKIIKDAGIALNPLTSSVTLKVGSGGQYTTINAALGYAVKKYYPIFLSGGTKPRVTIQLQAGFVMAEQVLVESLDLSWITITGVDAETVINRSALTTYWGEGYPAFGATNGGFLPIIGQLFNMDTSGTASNRHGILAYSNSRAIVLGGRGVKNAGTYGIRAYHGSTINAGGANASGAGTYGISAYHGSTINAEGANASGAGTYGIFAAYGSTINAYGANASGAGTYGIFAVHGSTINAYGANASGAGTYGISAYHGSTINAYGATGTLNQAKNTLTANGIIFQS